MKQVEQHFFMEVDGNKLFTVLHSPKDTSIVRGGIIFCDPWSREKLCVSTSMATFARMLASAAYYVLRLDCRGTGDSEGDARSVTPAGQCCDIKAAVKYLVGHGIQNIGLIGLRLGAVVALMVSQQDSRIRFLSLWDLPTEPYAHLRELYRTEVVARAWIHGNAKEVVKLDKALEQEPYVDVRGHVISREAAEGFKQVDIAQLASQFAGSLQALGIVHAAGKKQRAEARLNTLFKGGNGRYSTDVVIEDPFWTVKAVEGTLKPIDDLFTQTMLWLDTLD